MEDARFSCALSSNVKHLPKLYSLDIFQEGSDMTSSSNATSKRFYCGKHSHCTLSHTRHLGSAAAFVIYCRM